MLMPRKDRKSKVLEELHKILIQELLVAGDEELMNSSATYVSDDYVFKLEIRKLNKRVLELIKCEED